MASRILCKINITKTEVELADAFLVRFCRKVEILYGKDPNMHLHCHLKESILDYGPVSNFWLFTYQRYNGILEQYSSNNCSLEIQLMKRFLREFHLYTGLPHLPKELRDHCKLLSIQSVVIDITDWQLTPDMSDLLSLQYTFVPHFPVV